MTTPTDAEIREVWEQYNPLHGIESFARAVLAKWGQPQAVAGGEPVGKCCYGGSTPKSACASCAAWAPPPQAVREPLTKEQAASLCKMGPVYAPDGQVVRTPEQYRRELEDAKLAGIRTAERHHGIKGGQHGTE